MREDDQITAVPACRFVAFPISIMGSDLSWVAKAVWCAIYSFADSQTSSCFPSYIRIGEACNISESSVTRGVKELKEAGLIEIENRITSKGNKTSNLYKIYQQFPHERMAQNPVPSKRRADVPSKRRTDEKSTVYLKDGNRLVEGRVPSERRYNYNQLTKTNLTKDTPNPLKGAEDQIVSLNAKKKEVKAAEASTKLTDGFNAFWAAYPKRTDKGRARGAFKAAVGRLKKEIEGFDPSYLVFYAEIYAQKMKQEKTEDKYIKHPTTWLNADALYDYEIEGNLPAPGEYRAQQAQKRQQKKQEPVNHMTYGIFD